MSEAEGRLRRVTVNLTPVGQRALRNLVELTEGSQSEVINKALRVYEYLEQTWDAGGRVVLVMNGKGTDLRVL